METMQTWQHRSPWYPSESGVKLESLDESLVHDRENDETYVEHLVE
jgi:hypothetical protein